MFKQQVVLEVKKNSRDFCLILPPDTNLGELHDVLFEMRSMVIERILEQKKKEEPVPEKDETASVA